MSLLEWFLIKCRETKPKQLWLPITTDAENPINQSELEVKICNRRQARENACEPVTIGFAVTSDWLRKCQDFLVNHIA